MPDDLSFAPPAETLTASQRLAELADILAGAVSRANPPKPNENSPTNPDSSLDILALRRRLRRQLRNRVGGEE
ncbi:hypothetical protein PSA7680_02671 [Pseudoruegeria aquimaris]|uniref:Uncharacterized protein n=1 Tax=Pseudoruegeria aquimaris TaxID=393663 RepID=A0A1Y5T3I7_9RHOB|nr:hypothetical protein [Pseudoruegeria aquimaris]SLN51465.1 hypothetical protein PSA7680_02671 [Pseudoruegeria aquimaris]